MLREDIHTGDNLDELMACLTDFRARMVARKLQSLHITNDYIKSLIYPKTK